MAGDLPAGQLEGVAEPSRSEAGLPEWWNPGILLELIHDAIDRVVTDPWGKTGWYAASDVENGVVWVDERLVWKSLKAIACRCDIEFLLANLSTAGRRDFLQLVVRDLARRGKVAHNLLDNGYHQVPVNVYTARGRCLTRFLIPFHAAAFGESLADMAGRRSSLIRTMVVKIVPKQIDRCSDQVS